LTLSFLQEKELQMTSRICSMLDGRMLEATLTANDLCFRCQAVILLLMQQCAVFGCDKLLLCLEQLPSDARITLFYRFADELARLQVMKRIACIALVDRNGQQSDRRFIETSCLNRAVCLKSFESRAEAVEWLGQGAGQVDGCAGMCESGFPGPLLERPSHTPGNSNRKGGRAGGAT
jgi:hypothetical protein